MTYYITPGPSHPYPKLKQYLDDAWEKDVISWSHRGSHFIDLYKQTDQSLRQLMDIPAEYKILFVGSATEAMERVIEGVVASSSHHLILGAFGEKWRTIALQRGKKPTGSNIDVTKKTIEDPADIPVDAELVCVTMNETSSGVVMAPSALKSLGKRPTHQLLAMDIVSAAPVIPVDWQHTDIAFFSVQKAFGLPAGLGVLIVNERTLARSAKLTTDGIITGSYHSLLSLAKDAEKYQTYETPNVLGIYLLNRVVEDMLHEGIESIRKRMNVRAQAFYKALKSHPIVSTYIQDSAWQSPTVMVVDIKDSNAGLFEYLNKHHLIAGKGYASEHKDKHLRLANFPAIPDDTFDELIRYIQAWAG